MRRLLALAVVLALFGLSACGGGGDDGTGPQNFERGPYAYAMPLLPTVEGELLELGIQNLSADWAPVTVTAFTPGGAVYPGGVTTLTLPPRGSDRFPATNFTGVGIYLGGWLLVETRDTSDLDPATGIPNTLPSSGLVVPVMTRRTILGETDETGGLAFRSGPNWVTVNRDTTSIQLINSSWEPMAGGAVGAAVDFDVVTYDAYGDIRSETTIAVPPFGSTQVDFSQLDVGHVEVRPATGAGQGAPAGTEFRTCLAAKEAFAQVFFETRFLEKQDPDKTQLGIGFDLEFGIDVDYNIHDFGVFFSNPTDELITVQLAAVNTADGQNLLPNGQSRIVNLDPKTTKYMATTQLASWGLDQGEISIFADIFGNVDEVTGLTAVQLVLTAPRMADVSARDFDSRAFSYRRVVPAYRQTTDVVIPVMDYDVLSTTTTTNLATFANPYNTTVTVNVRGFTPGGTEYILDSFTVGPWARVHWSPDGLVFREDPTDVLEPPVQFMTFLYSASGGIFIDGRRLRTDALGRLQWQRPFYVRNLRAD